MANDLPEPNDASRQMMLVLANMIGDKMMIEAARVESLVLNSVIALREGRFHDFMRDAFAISEASQAINDQLMRSAKTHDAMHAADPAYAQRIDEVERNAIYQLELPKFEALPTIKLVGEYLAHVTQCQKPKCPTARAYVDVMKARGISPPSLEMLQGRRREG